ncbi:MAG TPA: nucleotidyltransferase domain-containing protein, partial [Hyphomicrobiaceae bacterium]
MTPDAIPDEIRAHIAARLAAAASEEGVRILYAAESGSRAWGFPSPDSDYDVRFLYAHARDWYVGLAEARDVIERPLDEQRVDLAGWDIRKALRLLLRSNPALYEWLVSPIVYMDDPLRVEMKALFEA